MLYAYIYRLIDWTPRRIDNLSAFPGKFFLAPLNQSTQHCQLGESNGFKAEVIKFFNRVSASSRTMAVVYFETDDLTDETNARSFLASHIGRTRVELCSRVIWVKGEFSENLSKASKFLRDSQSLSTTDFNDVSKLKVVADAKGIAIIDSNSGTLPVHDRFTRVCQLTALSCAYESVLDRLMVELSEAGLNNGLAAEKALREWSRFMSAYYFSEPVGQDTIELCKIYGEIKNRKKISDLAKEATEQLRLLAELVWIDRTENQAQREKKIQTRLTILGLLLTIFGLIQATQITPKTIFEFRENWTSCIEKTGFISCLIGNGATKIEIQDKEKPPQKQRSRN